MSSCYRKLCSTCHPSFKVLNSLRSLDLIQRLRSNRYPTELEGNELTQLMDGGEKELLAYSNAIYKLQETIISLSNEQDDLKRQLLRARSLLAPIRKLPPEILSHIFQYDAELDLTYQRRSVVPLTVASVSTYWRQTAMTTFSLWNRITLSVFQDPIAHQCASSLVQKAIDRCHKSSLFVTLRFDDVAFLNATKTNPAFALLCTQAQRWQSLSLVFESVDLESATLREVLNAIRGKLTSLQMFESDCFDSLQVPLLEDANKLTNLHTKKLLPHHQIPWGQITHLQVARSSNTEIVEILARLTNLKCLEVHCGSDEDEDGPPVFQIPRDDSPKPQIRSSLHSLSILCSSGVIGGIIAANLLDRLLLPSLKSLTIGSIKHDECPNTDRIVDSLESFFTRSSPTLTTLKMHDTMLRTERFLPLLKRLPALRTLSFSEPNCVSMHALNDEFFLRFRALQDSPPLCPRLESLQLEINSISFEPQLLVNMVQSRWMPNPEVQHDAACLRAFGIELRYGSLPASIFPSLKVLKRMGLIVSAEDLYGDIFTRG